MRHSVGPRKSVGERRTAVLSQMLRKGTAFSDHAKWNGGITYVAAVRSTGERIRVTRELGRQREKGDLN
jgi:hypothetical protein